MLTLLSTNEASQKLGISVQGIHYRIKTNKLKSIQKDGKTFVYVDIEEEKSEENQSSVDQTKEIIKSKDEQIGFLKKAIRFMTFQHKTELERMEKTHNKIIDVFKSEVELLQKAYNEMQTLYKTQQSTQTISYQPIKNEESSSLSKDQLSDLAKVNTYYNTNKNTETMPIEEFLQFLRDQGKSNTQIKHILYDAIKSGDKRFIYNPNFKKITVYRDNFLDLL